MPTIAPSRVCPRPACPNLQPCRIHDDARDRRSSRNHGGASRQQRGLGADWDAVRRFVLARDDYRCRIRGPRCKGKASTVDHIVPRSKGGARLDPANLQAACWSCNYGKGGKVPRATGVWAIHIVGAPGTGKTFLREELGEQLGLPTAGIDDERRKLLRPGEEWPEDDTAAWRALRAAAVQGEHVLETSGLAVARDRYLLAGIETFTIDVVADDLIRRARIEQRAPSDPMAGAGYVEKLMALAAPVVDADFRWRSGIGQSPGPVVAAVHDWIGQQRLARAS